MPLNIVNDKYFTRSMPLNKKKKRDSSLSFSSGHCSSLLLSQSMLCSSSSSLPLAPATLRKPPQDCELRMNIFISHQIQISKSSTSRFVGFNP
ncbi:hypothetical protein MtrunA17_Chr5g0430601 [Medicago truncatula]|uniref:Uncharacterized protein n=1 Tax=Medicago truncatula TaxID=3880 RepID=A0A396HX76_MEDTR|nr:hypothetical protein MtrunA17_Chr5g0430601 [Medicago truncatula]